MSRASPESVFALAQAAMECGDWEIFFGCLDRAVDVCLKSIKDLALFTAQVERLKRATLGEGSVSRSLFVGERLIDVKVTGTKATALRCLEGGWSEPIFRGCRISSFAQSVARVFRESNFFGSGFAGLGFPEIRSHRESASLGRMSGSVASRLCQAAEPCILTTTSKWRAAMDRQCLSPR